MGETRRGGAPTRPKGTAPKGDKGHPPKAAAPAAGGGRGGGQARRVALTGVLFALAMALGYLESLVTPLLGLPPGVKPGLANIVVMYALFFLSPWQALLLVVLKAGFGLITRGAVAGLLSLCGGLASLLVMALPQLAGRLWRRLRRGGPPAEGPAAGGVNSTGPSIFLLSIAGALAHNAGQLAVVRVLFGPLSLYYAPVLLVPGVAAGAATALSVRALAPALSRLGLARKI